MSETHILSKSTFLRGAQCQKSLYLDHYHHELREQLDQGAQHRMTLGLQVGELARNLFPGGELARAKGPFIAKAALNRTRELIEGGTPVIYEAAVQHDGVLTLLDILVRTDSGWNVYEVKSTTDVKDEHHLDVALQYFILNGLGMLIEDIYLLHLNRDYVRQGDLDLTALFTPISLLEPAQALQTAVAAGIEACKTTLNRDSVPEIDIGPYCKDPVECNFIGHCWAHVPEISVFKVHFLGKKAFNLYAQDVLRIEDIPEDYPLSKRSRFHVEAHKSGETIVDRQALRQFLDNLIYPLHYLDFETFMLPIPPFNDTRPYLQIPYQYSLHLRDQPGGVLQHSGFMAEAGTDPRQEFIERLLEDIQQSGTIMVYNLAFERGRLTELVKGFPEFADQLEDRIERLVDLMVPFQQRHLYIPEMHGSYSIKAVLPALVDDLSYEGMSISDGTQAMVAYLSLWDDPDPAHILTIRDELWEYCKLDTLAMVRIIDELERVIS
jgi:hypothetical protein